MKVWENTRKIVKERAATQGVKQCFLAKQCGFSDKDFSLIVNGRKPLTDETIYKLCRGLNVSPNDLFNFPHAQ